jgi:hypothetical protein
MASHWNEPNSSDRQEKPQDESLPKEIKDLAPFDGKKVTPPTPSDEQEGDATKGAPVRSEGERDSTTTAVNDVGPTGVDKTGLQDVSLDRRKSFHHSDVDIGTGSDMVLDMDPIAVGGGEVD